jgi:hypothetical protein
MDRIPQDFDAEPSPRSFKTFPLSYDYPSPAQTDTNSSSTSHSQALQGLGLYNYPTSITLAGTSMPASMTVSAHAVPTMFSSTYDPFSTYQSSFSQGEMYRIPRETAASNYPASPMTSCNASQRSSFSSTAASTAYSHSDVNVKLEGPADWPSESNLSLTQRPGEMHPSQSFGLPAMLQEGPHSYAGSSHGSGFDTPYYGSPSPLSWTKTDGSAEQRTAQRYLEDGPDASKQRRISTDATRSRQPRKLTTKEEANFQCQVKGCGKLFGRSYNYKAHLETHDAGRVYPFPCPVEDCSRRFVRKTDLQRHNQSVHMKQRDFKCDFCSRFFARKDTLRRYVSIFSLTHRLCRQMPSCNGPFCGRGSQSRIRLTAGICGPGGILTGSRFLMLRGGFTIRGVSSRGSILRHERMAGP